MVDESEDILLLKVLQCILFVVVVINDCECIEIFFSILVGEVVF